jgi:putative ABC transport system ATP-binding protein
VIRLSNIGKRYGSTAVARTALAGVDLTIERGEFVALRGPAGSGKTTLLNIVGLLDRPSSGTYRFADREVSRHSERELAALRQRGIAFIFQSPHLIEDLDVQANVELTLEHQSVVRPRRKQMVREMLELVGLYARAHDYPDELSPCEQRRVAIARALVNDPSLILADEPTSNLDDGHGAAIMDMIGVMNRAGATVLIATEFCACAAHAARIVQLRNGRVLPGEHGRI